MKSLLVEALRQKDQQQGSDDIQESRSSATPRADPAASSEELVAGPGNEVAEPDPTDDGDLELMATGSLVVANDDDDAATDKAAPEFTATVAAATTQLAVGVDIPHRQDSLPAMPPLARFAPILCLGLAAASAIGWFALQQLELRRDIFGAFVGMPDRAAVNEPAALSTSAPRFRYLGLDGRPLDDEVPQ